MHDACVHNSMSINMPSSTGEHNDWPVCHDVKLLAAWAILQIVPKLFFVGPQRRKEIARPVRAESSWPSHSLRKAPEGQHDLFLSALTGLETEDRIDIDPWP